MQRNRRAQILLWACLPLSAFALGCGRSEYEARLDEAIQELKLSNKFVGLDLTETLLAAIKNDQGTGAKISFRKPTYFANAAMTLETADRLDPTKPINPERVRPPQMMDFPGFQFSYEQRSFGGLGFAHVYLGAQPADPAAAEKIEADLKAVNDKLNPVPPPPQWTTLQIETVDGGVAPWKMISQSAPNVFWQEGNTTPEDLPGTFTIWMREDKGFQVFLGLRTSKLNVDEKEMNRVMQAAAGTVRVVSPVKID